MRGACATGAPAAATVALSRPGAARADFGLVRASAEVRVLANWVVQTGDQQGLPFVLVDKIHAQVFVFDRRGRLQGAAPALLGLARGDDGVVGIGERPLSRILPGERTTPAGRFLAEMAFNVAQQSILWVDYEQAISLHPVRTHLAQERRVQRLQSPPSDDNRISYGCINVSVSFWEKVLVPALSGQQGVVYVMPETRPLSSVFAVP